MIREAAVILAGLFIIGVAGGLEKGMVSVQGALIAWGLAVVTIAVLVLIPKKAKKK